MTALLTDTSWLWSLSYACSTCCRGSREERGRQCRQAVGMFCWERDETDGLMWGQGKVLTRL